MAAWAIHRMAAVSKDSLFLQTRPYLAWFDENFPFLSRNPDRLFQIAAAIFLIECGA